MYLQIHDALADRIAAGQWKPGQIVPNEVDLAREFGVSPGTMRKAFDLLEKEQLVTRRQGRGTFVNDASGDALVNRYTSLRDVDGKPPMGPVTVTGIEKTIADNRASRRLELNQQDPIFRFRRIRTHRDRPLMYEEVSLPAALFPDLSNRATHRITRLAQEFGLLLGGAEEHVSIGAACYYAADALQIAAGSPVMVLDRVVRTIDGRPAEWRVAQCLARDTYYVSQMG